MTDNHPLATQKEFATIIMSTQPSNSSSTSLDLPVVQKSSFSIPHSPSFRRSTSSAYDSLYEYTCLPEDSKILITDLPCLNPYTAVSKPTSSILKCMKTLIHKPTKVVKEYVASTSFDQHPILSTQQEQFVTLAIPPKFIPQ